MMNGSVVEILQFKQKLKDRINTLKAETAEIAKNHRSDTNNQIIKDLKNVIPGCEIHIFGSRLTGLVTRESDCDIYINHDGRSYYSDLSQERQREIILEAGNNLNDQFYMICILPNAKVPILRVAHNNTDSLCDISCKSGLPVESSILIREFLTSDFRVSSLAITIGWWVRTNGLKGTNKFTSCITTWLVLFFLMRVQPCILGSVMDMREGCSQKLIGNWDCGFNRDFQPPKLRQNPNLDSRFKLLIKFFKFYSSFDFDQFVLCPLTAIMLPRQEFKDLTLPPAYRSYAKVAKTNPNIKLEIGTPLCIQDPFDLSLNIAKGVGIQDLKKFKSFCDQSYRICESNWGASL